MIRIAGQAYIPTERNVPLGRTLYLTPTLHHFAEPAYSWSVDGVARSTDKIFAFTPSAEGDYRVTLRSDSFSCAASYTFGAKP